MVIEYLTYQLIDGYKSGDGNITAFLDYYDFYLVPFHNPDGKLPNVALSLCFLLVKVSTSALPFGERRRKLTSSQALCTPRRTTDFGVRIVNLDRV